LAKKKTKGGASSSKSPSSAAPPPPPTSSTPYLIGIVIFGLGIAALLYTRCSEETQAQAPTAKTTPTQKPTGQPVNAELPEFAPPPPPEEDAGTDAGDDADAPKSPVKTASTGNADAPAGPTGACAACGKGTPSSALVSAVRGTAGTAQGCHNRALRNGGVQGRMNVAVSVGSNGSVCAAGVTSDSVGDPGLSNCVLGKFRGRSYPKPESGCVVINVPLNFAVK
jgi:outer membrane biosynthesis protein TonB